MQVCFLAAIILVFSVGAVFAQQIGYYRPTDTNGNQIKVKMFSSIKMDSSYLVAAMLNDNPEQGILIGSSPDLNSWTTHGIALTTRGTEDSAMVWSPHLIKDGTTYYMFYTGVSEPQSGQYCQRILVASTTTPTNPASWQRNNSVQFNVGGTLQSWFRPSHTGTVWSSTTQAECRDPFVINYAGTWYMFYSGKDTTGSIIGVCSASNILGPWIDHGAVYKQSTGFFESPNVIPLADGKFIMSLYQSGVGQRFARGISLTPINGNPSFSSLTNITNTTKTPLTGWAFEFLPSADLSYDRILASLDNYDIKFYKSWFVKETHGWMVAASPGRQYLGLFSSKNPDNTKRFIQDFSIFKHQGQMYCAPMLKYESNKGVLISRSSDLNTWQDLGLAASTRTPECASMVWAPHVVEEDGIYYMFYTGVTTPSSGQWCQRILVATTTTPEIPSSWQRDYNVQFVVDGVSQSWFRPSHAGAVWTSTAWADCRDAMLLKHNNTWYMFYSGTDTDGGICGVATAPSIRGPWIDHGAVLKTPTGIPESCFVLKAPDGSWVMVMNHAGASTGGGIKTARGNSLVPINGQPSFSDLRMIYDTSALPLRGWAHEFLPGEDYGCDILSSALGYYEAEFSKAYFVKEPWGWTVAAEPTPIQKPPVNVGATISSNNLLADGTTVYSVTATCQDSNGGDDIIDMKIIFNLDTSTYDDTQARGLLAWGKTLEVFNEFGDNWTINSANDGYWGFINGQYGSQYIEPVSCTTTVVGTYRKVTWTFKVNPIWAIEGPQTGNFITMWGNDTVSSAEDLLMVPDVQFSIESSVCPTITTQPVSQTICSQNTATFTVSADGTPSFSYKWRKDGVDIPNTNSSSYTTNIAGAYSCVVSNSCGSVVSEAAQLTVVDCLDIPSAKMKPDGFVVGLYDKIVTGVWADSFYIQESSRTSGILVRKTGHSFALGDSAEVHGIISTNVDMERYIEAESAAKISTGTINPFYLTLKSLGGTDFFYNPQTGAGQKGVNDGYGLNNIGLLVKISGEVTSVGSNHIFINDGSSFDVMVVGNSSGISVGDYVQVTGISSCYLASGGTIERRILSTLPITIIPR